MCYEIELTRLMHRDLTKTYSIDFIEREDHAVLLIFRWGKVDTSGRLQSHFYEPHLRNRARAAQYKKLKDKIASGYFEEEHAKNVSFTVPNQRELVEFYLGGWQWFRIPENHRNLITDNYSEAKEFTLLNSQTEQVDMAAIYANHPLYGRF